MGGGVATVAVVTPGEEAGVAQGKEKEESVRTSHQRLQGKGGTQGAPGITNPENPGCSRSKSTPVARRRTHGSFGRGSTKSRLAFRGLTVLQGITDDILHKSRRGGALRAW